LCQKYGRRTQTSGKSPLELEADRILEQELKNTKSNKAKSIDFLSEYQLARRQRRELPFSDLSKRDKLRLGIEIEGDKYNE